MKTLLIGSAERLFGPLVALTCIFQTFSGCEKPKPSAPQAEKVNAAILQTLDVCSLLRADEVAAIQGFPVKQSKSNISADGKFLTRQCFYEMNDFNRSVNLALTSRDPNSATPLSPGALWKEKFASYRTGAREEEKDEKPRATAGEEEGERHDPPQKVEGLGDDAFWMGPDALYVLHGDVFLRLSVGGNDSPEIKLRKAKDLMKPALARLAALGSNPGTEK